MRDKGESEEQNGFGSHLRGERRIYTLVIGSKRLSINEGRISISKKKREKINLVCKERQVCETELRIILFW